MKTFKELLNNPKVQGAIAIVAAIVMYYTPDHIDRIIEAMLATLGITKITLTKD